VNGKAGAVRPAPPAWIPHDAAPLWAAGANGLRARLRLALAHRSRCIARPAPGWGI